MSKKAPAIEAVPGKAWEFDGGLCRWAEPDANRLDDSKPSPEARKVSVRIVRTRDYNRLLRAWRQMHGL